MSVPEFQRVSLTGRLDYDRQFRLGPRSAPPQVGQGTALGAQGYYLLTPLTLSDGQTIILNRGWVDRTTANAALPYETPKVSHHLLPSPPFLHPLSPLSSSF